LKLLLKAKKDLVNELLITEELGGGLSNNIEFYFNAV